MFTISMISLATLIARAIVYLASIPFFAFMILFPINDKPTSRGQKITFAIVMLAWFDILFTHFIWSYVTAHVLFVP